MSRYPSFASRAAYSRCPETCQTVQAEMREAIERVLAANLEDYTLALVKDLTDAAFDIALWKGTQKVRAALIECEDERIEAGEVIAGLERDLVDAKETIACLRAELEDAEKELDSERARVLELEG